MSTKEIWIEIVPAERGQFEMYKKGAKITRITFDKDVDTINGQPMKKTDDYLVHLEIGAKCGLVFDPNAADAMWIKKGTPTHSPRCFKTKHNQGKDEFDVRRISDYRLDVANLDKKQCKFRFVLNFVDKAGQRVQFDPIMSNRNGGS